MGAVDLIRALIAEGVEFVTVRLICGWPYSSITITRRMDAKPTLAISFRTRSADMPAFFSLMAYKRLTSAATWGFLRISYPPAAASFPLYPAAR